MPIGKSDYVHECEQSVCRPGKFQSEKRYVPHFWMSFLEGYADEDIDGALGFRVGRDDREMFPELQGVKMVWLRERDDGFVCETGAPSPV